jgi:hypothetical protein
MNKFKKLKEEAHDYYNQWRKEKTFCPAFGEEIIVSRKGWDHIVGFEKYRRRPIKDVIRRFKLLQYAKGIIETTSDISEIRSENGIIFYSLEKTVLDFRSKYIKVQIIFIEDKSGKKIFFSIM